MKAKQLAALCSCLAITATAYPAYNGSYSNKTTAKDKEEKADAVFFEQGSPICDQYGPAYNQAGGVKLRDMGDFYASASFIYWMANAPGFNESQFPFANVSISTILAPPVGAVVANGHGSEVVQQPKFKPGFKVGLGYGSNYDDWRFYGEWTWLHEKTRSSFGAHAGNVFVVDNTPYNVIGDRLNSDWHLNLDLADFSLSRNFYVGKRVILQPMLGVRGAWFKQTLNVSVNSKTGTPWASNAVFNNSATAHIQAKSWGVGARAGMTGQCLLGAGFRIDGKGSLSLLFTRFHSMRFLEVGTNLVTLTPTTVSAKWNQNLSLVTPQAELGLGLGWGTYFCKHKCHFDLDLTYDFNVFWDQNVVRTIGDSITRQIGLTPTALSYHGPTFSARLDF